MCVYVCVYVCVCVCMYVCVNVYAYVYMYVYVCVFTPLCVLCLGLQHILNRPRLDVPAACCKEPAEEDTWTSFSHGNANGPGRNS